MELTSSKIKALLFSYFRFKRHYLGVLSEYQFFYSDDIEDFIAFKDDEIVCVEIKVSKSDFLADFKNKQKHKNGLSHIDKFYFCVTEELSDFAKDFLEKSYPAYGLLVARNIKGSEIMVAKTAKRLRKKLMYHQHIFSGSNNALRDSLILRMSSELANLRSKFLSKGENNET